VKDGYPDKAPSFIKSVGELIRAQIVENGGIGSTSAILKK
jgi:hypothetical protein